MSPIEFFVKLQGHGSLSLSYTHSERKSHCSMPYGCQSSFSFETSKITNELRKWCFHDTFL